MNIYVSILIVAVICLIIGYCGEGNEIRGKLLSPREKFCKVLKWLSIVVISIYVLAIVAALTDGIGDVPLLGGGYVWVRGHWRRR